jgi:hypothetical protein
LTRKTANGRKPCTWSLRLERLGGEAMIPALVRALGVVARGAPSGTLVS